MDVLVQEAQTKAVRVLLYHCLLVSENDFVCGNCGTSAEPMAHTFCTACTVQWRFSATTYPPPNSLYEQARQINALLPSSLVFIGYVDAEGVHEAYLPLNMS